MGTRVHDKLQAEMKYFTYLFLIFILFSCEKPMDRPCFKKSGKQEEKVILLGSFDRLFLKEHIKYILIQDSTDKLVLRGGANLLNFIHVDTESGLVSISNRNKCNFLRSYEVVEVEIHFTKIINILYEGTETLVNVDTLHTDYLALTLRDGGGSMNLCVDAIDIKAINTHGWGDLSLSGKTNSARLLLLGDGCFNTRNLITNDSLNISSSSSRKQQVNVLGIPLKAEINGIGNIEYYGIPSLIHFSKYGEGSLIDMN